MFSYCLKCRKNTVSKNPKVVKTKNERMLFSKSAVCKNGRIMLLSKCVVCDCKTSRFIKSKKLVDY